MKQLYLSILKETYGVCRAEPGSNIPTPAPGQLWSVTQTDEELSVIINQEFANPSWRMEKDWRAIKVDGPLDFSLTGILARLAQPLAEANISIFAISTFDTDYLLVKQKDLSKAMETLTKAGHLFTDE